jgi:lipoyl(octanoyl) transferase
MPVCCRTLDSVSGIKAGRIEGLTGVWVNDAKVAAIGIRARRWVTYHGLAINVVPDLAPFQHIVPCGIADKAVTSVKELLQAQNPGPWGPAEDAALLEEYAHGLLAAFSEVFNVTLVEAQNSLQVPIYDSILVGR